MTDEELKAKQKEYRRRYYLKHKEERDLKNREWKKANPEKRREEQRRYYHSHADKMREYHKKYSALHPLTPEQEEKRREYSREYARTHRDYFNAKLREYRRRQKEEKNNACN